MVGRKNRAFTLGELAIVLVTISVIAALVIPLISKMEPDSSRIKFKKAYLTLEQVVYEIINDDLRYPIDVTCGVDEDNEPVDCDLAYNTITTDMLIPSGQTCKFQYLFADKLNVLGNITYTACKTTFTTSDGTAWTISPWTNDANGWASHLDIKIDVNNTELPNSQTDADPDIFVFKLYRNGKIELAGNSEAKAREYLENPTTNVK